MASSYYSSLSIAWSTMVLVISMVNPMPIAYAQYANSNSTATPQQLAECKIIGISPSKCSDEEILKHLCIGGIGAPCGGAYRPPELDPVVLSILVGSGIALITGTLYVMKVRKVGEK